MVEPRKVKIDQKKIKSIVRLENLFIKNLFSMSSLPEHSPEDDHNNIALEKEKLPVTNNKTGRATCLIELQERINKLKSKDKVSYKDKLQKKALKKQLQKKIKLENRNKVPKVNRSKPQKLIKTETENDTPGEVNENKMLFSKIDFANLGKKKQKKVEKDPVKILEKVQETKERIEELKATGQVEKAHVIKEKTAWHNAVQRATGIKVKDDPILLKKTIKKNEQKKRSSKKKWETRIEGVKRAQDERQQKRTENIDKRKKEKKVNKMKKSAKKGKIIPGF